MRNFLVLLFLLSGAVVQAQVFPVKGRVMDASDKTPVAGATVSLVQARDTSLRRDVVSDVQGNFNFPAVSAGRYRIQISFIGLERIDTLIMVRAAADLGELNMQKAADLLGEVVFQAQTPTVRQKNDTLEYGANAYKVNPDATIEDMVKKMPGITIENGQVKAGGEDVRRVTIDGREFFGEDATAALRNLPAEVVDKIQVFDRLSDQAQFTGFDDGNTTKAINVVTRANMRNGQFGRVYAGYGTDDRYSAGGNVTLFNGTRRISLVGLSNNINQQNFATEDLLGVTSSPGRRGGGGRMGGPGGGGGNFRGGGGQGNFLVGQQGGISKTNSFGINYSDKWGDKVDVSGSYFFNNSNNTNSTDLTRQIFLSADSSQFYRENSLSTGDNSNHRLNMRIEYKIDSNNTLLFTPSMSIQKNTSFSTESANLNSGIGDIISETINNYQQNSSGINLNNGILYRHAFAKRGRTLSLNLNTGYNNRDGGNMQDAISRYYKSGIYDTTMQMADQLTKGYNVSANVAYTEPVGKGQLQFNYNPAFSGNNADQRTWIYDNDLDKYSRLDSTQSNVYDNTYNTQSGGVSYRLGDRERMFSIGLSYQYARLSGTQVFPDALDISRNFSNLLPNLMLSNKISPRSHIRMFYRGSTNAPSITQLQDVINRSNPLFLQTGNPDLNQSYNHRVSARYSYTNPGKSSSLFANIFYTNTSDYIGTASYVAAEDSVISNTITLNKGSQISKPVNMDGSWSLRSFVTYGMPLKVIKTNLNLNMGYSLTQTPGIINNIENLSRTQNYNVGAVLASNVSEYIDFTISYSANFNKVRNTIQPQLNNNYFNQSASAELNLLSKSGWLFQNSLNNQMYRGLTDDFNQNFWLWNMSVGKKFLKDQKGELRLTVFDLLKQNQSIARVTTETYIEDTQTRVLQQYFMLTFSYRLRNFGGR